MSLFFSHIGTLYGGAAHRRSARQTPSHGHDKPFRGLRALNLPTVSTPKSPKKHRLS
jgi:hypothetical protein